MTKTTMCRALIAGFLTASALTVSTATGTHAASLDGDSVTGVLTYNNLGFNFFNTPVTDATPTTAIVGAGIEFNGPTNSTTIAFDVDLSGVSLTASLAEIAGNGNATVSFDLILGDLDFAGHVISGFNVTSDTWPGAEVVLVSDNGIRIDFTGGSIAANQVKSFSGDFVLAAVPLPATGMLLLGAFGLAGAVGRKARRR